jgi:CheY-like chemotaxis protein
MIVDDSKLARMSVARTLTKLHPDWEQVEAATTDDAIAQVRAHPVHMALLDINMPGRDGLELAAELRAIDAGMPLAIVSANHQTEIVARAAEIGAGFLGKPLTEVALAAFLESAVAQLERR